jgi:hypothetical protein
LAADVLLVDILHFITLVILWKAFTCNPIIIMIQLMRILRWSPSRDEKILSFFMCSKVSTIRSGPFGSYFKLEPDTVPSSEVRFSPSFVCVTAAKRRVERECAKALKELTLT